MAENAWEGNEGCHETKAPPASYQIPANDGVIMWFASQLPGHHLVSIYLFNGKMLTLALELEVRNGHAKVVIIRNAFIHFFQSQLLWSSQNIIFIIIID